MLHIQKALEKVKADSPKQASSWVHTPLENIQYNDTEIQQIDRHELIENRIIASTARDSLGQLFRTLRTKVLREMRKNSWRSVGVTSPHQGEGKSTIAANLAIALAMELNQSVLLIDMDLGAPAVAELFGLDVKYGLGDYLDGTCELNDVLINPGIDRFVILPGKGSRANSAELLSSPKMTSFIKEAKDRYRSRVIVMDLPAVLPTDDVMSAFGYVDSSLLVVEDGRCSRTDLKRSVQLLRGANLLGTVLNKVNSVVSQLRPMS